MATSKASWTNESVRGIADREDPIGFVIAKARAVTLDALEEGWDGPPFDPVRLAEFLGIQVSPRDGIADARIVPQPGGQLLIEFNPNRPRGRIRYSIAHEIVHTFFPDCGLRVRNREEKAEVSADEWQLEMLCNIGAAELLMPVGSFPDLAQQRPSIDALMEIRRAYDVSTEALLLRFIRLTDHPCCMFAASLVEVGEYAGRFRIDYAVPSRAWGRPLPGTVLPDSTELSDCNAIGYTAVFSESWPPENGALNIECVGVPPYPGSTHPRVLGIALGEEFSRDERSIVYVVGDATKPRGSPPIVLVQVMNDTSATWGGGFSKKLAIAYSDAQIDYRRWAAETANRSLGSVHFFGEPKGITIATIVAQVGVGARQGSSIRYAALEEGLRTVAKRANELSASVHMPKIGCGIAGGKWEVVSELIEQSLVKERVPVFVYDLAGQR